MAPPLHLNAPRYVLFAEISAQRSLINGRNSASIDLDRSKFYRITIIGNLFNYAIDGAGGAYDLHNPAAIVFCCANKSQLEITAVRDVATYPLVTTAYCRAIIEIDINN